MNLSNFLTVKAIISIVFSSALLTVPEPLMSMFGVQLSETGVFIVRLFGVDVMGIGFVCWFSRKSRGRLVSDIVLGLFIADAIGLIVLTIGQLSGIMNPLGWANVVVWLFLTLGLGYFRFIKPVTN
jgi:hypothetical protein